MTKEQLASQLNGRQMGHEITPEEEKLAKESGLVVLFGYSDDNAEFRGAIKDEIGCYNGGDLRVHHDGVLEAHEDCECEHCGFKVKAGRCSVIEAVWDGDSINPPWTYETGIPHASFMIFEGEDGFCRGIVFDVAILPSLK